MLGVERKLRTVGVFAHSFLIITSTHFQDSIPDVVFMVLQKFTASPDADIQTQALRALGEQKRGRVSVAQNTMQVTTSFAIRI